MKRNMNAVSLILIGIIFAACSFNCNSNRSKNESLPKERPAGLVIQYELSGGMAGNSETVFLSADSCTIQSPTRGNNAKIRFTISKELLDKIYSVLRENEFDRITTYEQAITDRGGISIGLSWAGGKSAVVSNRGTSFVDDKWRSQWDNCVLELANAIQAETDKLLREYEIRIDKSFFGMTINMYIGQESIINRAKIYAEGSETNFITRRVKLYPGYSLLKFSWDEKFFADITLNPDEAKGVMIALEKNQLKSSFIK